MIGSEMKDRVLELPIEKIFESEWDVRRYPDSEEDLDALGKSIKESGLLNPLTVMDNKDGRYMLVAGRRRFRVCKKLGRTDT
jgi:ParB/RepB/Spo0J family partition protein